MPSMTISKHQIFFAGLAVLIISMIPVSVSLADDDHASGSYSRPNHCDSGGLADPVGVIFFGDKAGVANITQAIRVHTDWYLGGGGLGNQALKVYDDGNSFVCRQTDEHNLQNSDPRFHIRLWRSRRNNLDPKTAGTPHYERIACGLNHAVYSNNELNGPSGFDVGRQALTGQFENGGHDHNPEFWGNTNSLEQCNGKYAASNGTVQRIKVDNDH